MAVSRKAVTLVGQGLVGSQFLTLSQCPCRYYRSGTEMLRMANVYLREGNHENAFILYLRYMTLFIEKIRQHPDYGSVKAEVRDINRKIKENHRIPIHMFFTIYVHIFQL